MNCDLEDVKSIQKCAEISGRSEMFSEVAHSFTKVVMNYAIHDEKLIKRITKSVVDGKTDHIYHLVVEWYYSQVPVVPNEMFNDLMCKASGFVFFDEVTKVLTDLILER